MKDKTHIENITQARRLIDAYRNNGKDQVDLKHFKLSRSKDGMANYPIKTYIPRVQKNVINFRIETPFPNCEIDDVLVYF